MKKTFLFSMIALLSVSFIFMSCPQPSDPPAYTVTFNSNDGSAVESITDLASGAKITAPTAPTKAENDFAGWYKEEALKTAWNFATDTVTANITLYAKWTPYTDVFEYTLSNADDANPSGVSIASAKRSTVTGITTIKLTGTVSGGLTDWSKNNIWATGITPPDSGNWSWVVITGILNTDALLANTIIKQTNQALRYYENGNDILSDEPSMDNPPTGSTHTIYISLDKSVAYKLKKYTSANGAVDTSGDKGFGVLLWSEASPKRSTLEITPASGAAYTVIVDWSGLTIN